jgi:hypothetical protein
MEAVYGSDDTIQSVRQVQVITPFKAFNRLAWVLPPNQTTVATIARTSLAIYFCPRRCPQRCELVVAVSSFVTRGRSGRDAALTGSTRELVRVLLHRGETNGSSKEAWTQVRCEEGRWQKEQGVP